MIVIYSHVDMIGIYWNDMIGICHVNYWTIDADIIGMIVILSLQQI
jgi:hypothetical protein